MEAWEGDHSWLRCRQQPSAHRCIREGTRFLSWEGSVYVWSDLACDSGLPHISLLPFRITDISYPKSGLNLPAARAGLGRRGHLCPRAAPWPTPLGWSARNVAGAASPGRWLVQVEFPIAKLTESQPFRKQP